MQPSLVGLVICGVLLLVGRTLGAPLLVPLVASLAFGSTALGTLPALGGASPLIYTFFVILLLLLITLRVELWRELTAVFVQHGAPWLVVLLTAYVVGGALLFPRMFADWTSVFVPAREIGLVLEVPLQPVAGNITQTAYFTFGAMAFLALSVVLLRIEKLEGLRRGFFLWAILIAAGGAIDLAGKLAGAGDVLEFLRTATYAMATEAEHAGFFRIAGLFSEASSFAISALSSLAFTYTYWRATGSRSAAVLALTLVTLLILSTSTTAYVGFAVLCLAVFVGIVHRLLRGQVLRTDLILAVVVLTLFAIVLALLAANRHALEGFEELLRLTIFEKSNSASGVERSHWNMRSLESFLDTFTLGVGLGSSRASNWIIAVLSQLGLVGAALLAVLVLVLAGGARFGKGRLEPHELQLVALHDSVRAAALTALMAVTIVGGAADPGLLFFISLATVIACRAALAVRSGASPLEVPVHVSSSAQRAMGNWR